MSDTCQTKKRATKVICAWCREGGTRAHDQQYQRPKRIRRSSHQFRSRLCYEDILLSSMLHLLATALLTQGCTNILVSKGASADGSTMVSSPSSFPSRPLFPPPHSDPGDARVTTVRVGCGLRQTCWCPEPVAISTCVRVLLTPCTPFLSSLVVGRWRTTPIQDLFSGR